MGDQGVGRAVLVFVNGNTGTLIEKHDVLILVDDVKVNADASKGMLVSLLLKELLGVGEALFVPVKGIAQTIFFP